VGVVGNVNQKFIAVLRFNPGVKHGNERLKASFRRIL
jgi:hypothetical protein